VVKYFFKVNSHNKLSKALAGFGRSLNRYYENRNHRTESNGEVTVLKKLNQFNPGVIIDGGANVGNYLKLINKHCPKARVYSFEPVPDTFNKLKYGASANQNNVLVNKGLFKDNCTFAINVFPSDEHASIFDISAVSQNPVSTVDIDLVKGDDFADQEKIDEIFFLKLDLEGAEFDALEGFERMLKKGAIKVIQFEYGYINIITKKLLIDYYKFFEKYGYKVGKIFPKIVEFRQYNYKYEDFIGPNFIAVKSDETAIIEKLANK